MTWSMADMVEIYNVRIMVDFNMLLDFVPRVKTWIAFKRPNRMNIHVVTLTTSVDITNVIRSLAITGKKKGHFYWNRGNWDRRKLVADS